MVLALPKVDETELTRSPLAVVVFQLRYEQNLGVSDGDVALSIHESLGGRDGQYPRIEPLQLVTAQIDVSSGRSALGGLSSVPTRGWRLVSEDGDWSAAIMPDHIALETNAYGTWSHGFRERIHALLEAVHKHAAPRIEERLGLRYVNRLTESTSSPRDWSEFVSAELLGPLADDFWGPGVENLQQQVQLDLGSDLRCLFRHGLVPRENGMGFEGYLLDFDVFRQIPRRFSLDDAKKTLDEMNRAALALFQKSLAPHYLATLRRAAR